MGIITSRDYTIIPDDVVCHVYLEFGKFCSIASGLKIVSGQHPAVEHKNAVSNFPFNEHDVWDEYLPSNHQGSVIVQNDVWIGEDVRIVVKDKIGIGNGAVIAANSVVTKYVPDYAIVAGNPAEIKGFRFSNDIIGRLLELAWWDWPKEKIDAALPEMQHINAFLRKYYG